MRHRLILGSWLVLVWLELWGDLSWANLFSGMLVAGFVVWLWSPKQRLGLNVRPVALARFIGFFIASLVKASVEVAREVVRLDPQLRSAVVAVPIRSQSRGMIAVVAAAVSLTPGTLVIETALDGLDTTLFIHVFDLQDRDALVASVRRLEDLAIAALAPTVSQRTHPGSRPSPLPNSKGLT